VKQVPIRVAVLVAVGVIAVFVAVILATEGLLGLHTGWVIALTVCLLFSIAKPPYSSALPALIGGGLYGILVGQLFKLSLPAFMVALLIVVTCKIANKLPLVMNDYALCFMTVYTISGVAQPGSAWQDVAVFVVTMGVAALATTLLEKRKPAVAAAAGSEL